MDLPREVDDYIKQSIDHTLGLPVSTHTLELKLRCSEEAKLRLRDQYTLLLAKLKEKDQALERSRVRVLKFVFNFACFGRLLMVLGIRPKLV